MSFFKPSKTLDEEEGLLLSAMPPRSASETDFDNKNKAAAEEKEKEEAKRRAEEPQTMIP